MKRAKQHPKMLQHRSNMAPKSAQVGAMLGSKTVMDPPKSEAKTMSKKCLQKVDFWSHLGGILGRINKKNPLRRVDPRGGWIARIARIGKNCQELPWCPSQLHPARRGAPDPLALRANPATVPGTGEWASEVMWLAN